MSVLVDSNVLLRSADPADSQHLKAADRIAALIREGETLVITPQIAAEFWCVATRPTVNNGLGMSTTQARDELARLDAFVSILDESSDVLAEWKRLVVAHDVKGVQAHDARLAAAMKVYGVQRIATFNGNDFKRYDVEVIEML